MSSSTNLRGIGAMLFAVAMFSLMDTGLKLLSPHYPAMQVAAMRALSSLPLVIVYVAWRGAFGSLRRIRWPLHLLRGVLGIAMLSLFAFSLRELPLAEAYSIFFVAPLLITALSVPLLGERVDRRAGSRSWSAWPACWWCSGRSAPACSRSVDWPCSARRCAIRCRR